jgi:osmotically-inducible protein OsmY
MNNFRKPAAVAMTIAIMMVSGCNVFRGESTPGQYVDDVGITANVKSKLLESGKVDGLDVNVDSTNGNVKLTGWASTPTEAKTAGDLARSVEHVKSVDNQLKIKDKKS